MPEWKVQKFSVNSEVLFKEVSMLVEAGIKDLDVIWNSEAHRESFVSVVEDWLEALSITGKIEQFKSVCDLRNNKIKDMEKGVYHLDVCYQQQHCLNTTRLRYTITTNETSTEFIIE